jgi:hypothetical protein
MTETKFKSLKDLESYLSEVDLWELEELTEALITEAIEEED